ncbi:MAG: outer rane efflux protein [Acidobacteriaceae bacterium]|nr:outer rane efflux protein [Acidobacteriaceae bacterium]
MRLPNLNSLARMTGIVLLAHFLSNQSWAQGSEQANQANLPQSPQPMAAQSPQSQSQSRPYSQSAPDVAKDYSKGRSQFPNIIAPYIPQHVPPPSLTNTPRINELFQNGKLMLSMDDAVALTLENNLDLVIARYNLNIADTDILRSKAGSNVLGVNTGVVQNTPGGGTGGLSGTVGSGAGGTSVAAGGIGTGTNGLVSSTLGIGSPITSFDPIITGTLEMDRAYSLSGSALNGQAVTNNNTGTADITYQQGFQWGTNMQVGFNNTHLTTSGPLTALSPEVASNFQFRLTQHLFQGFGFLPNQRFIRIAKNNREISDVAFRLQIITTVDQIENLYWNLVYAYENMKVQQEALAFAQRTLEDTKKQVQLGTLPPIQVASAQSTVSSDQQALTLARTNLELQELLMKNALSRNLEDPVLAGAEVIPTSTIQLPEQEPVAPIQYLIYDAISHRAELAESRIDLTTRDMNNKSVRNAMLPTVDLFAFYGGSGLGGNLNANASFCSGSTNTGLCINRNRIPSQFLSGPVGYGSTLTQLFDSTAPDKGLGVTLNIPLKNRTGQADQVRAELEYRQAQVRLQQLENQVRIEVRNAQFDVEQNRAAVDAAQAAVSFERQTLNADQQKLAVGVGTPTAVLQDESNLTTTESNLVSAMANYEKARVELDRATGLLLDHAGIVMADAERGQVSHMPSVPFVAPRQDAQPVMPPANQAPQHPPAQPQQQTPPQ